jgi:N-methylhydantoinase B
VVRLASGKTLKTKGKQIVPAGERLLMELPGGGGYGDPAEREHTLRERDHDNEID